MVSHLPRGEAIAVSEMFNHILQRLVLRDVHIIADITLGIPLVDHSGWHYCCGLEAFWNAVQFWSK